jgi:hypothetical protein
MIRIDSTCTAAAAGSLPLRRADAAAAAAAAAKAAAAETAAASANIVATALVRVLRDWGKKKKESYHGARPQSRLELVGSF